MYLRVSDMKLLKSFQYVLLCWVEIESQNAALLYV